MERYSITNVGSTDPDVSSTQAAGAILALNSPGTTRRGWLYDLIFGIDDTAADNQIGYYLSRHTDITGNTVVPSPLDAGAPAAVLQGADGISSVTLTGGADLLYFAANHRSTQRWVAAPGGELIVPAAANDGLTFSAVHASATPNVAVTIHFAE